MVRLIYFSDALGMIHIEPEPPATTNDSCHMSHDIIWLSGGGDEGDLVASTPITLHQKVPPTPYLRNAATPMLITNICKCFTTHFGCLYNLDYCFRFAFAVRGEVTIGAIHGLYPSVGNTLVKSADEAKMSSILNW
jgi:hypothetical protein